MNTHTDNKDSFILCENLVKIFKIEDVEVVALQGLDIRIRRGELIAIIGPSGSGKTTLLNVLGGLDAPSAGKVRVAGVDLLKINTSERLRYRRRSVGFVWQNIGRNLIPYLSAVENVEMPMILSGTFDRGRAHRLLELVGLEKRKRHQPRHMSGGEQQRVAIAIALANEPPVLLADEPTGSLDTENTLNILKVFDDVRRELGVTVVIVTHNALLAEAVDRYVAIHDGKTSTEAVRKGSQDGEEGNGVIVEPHSSGKPEGIVPNEESHEHYTLLDSAGRLQLPAKMLKSYDIRDRVKLIDEGDRIVILPPEKKEKPS